MHVFNRRSKQEQQSNVTLTKQKPSVSCFPTRHHRFMICLIAILLFLFILMNVTPGVRDGSNYSFVHQWLLQNQQQVIATTENTAWSPSYQKQQEHLHRVAGLSCDAYGGPTSVEALEEMIYWYDIPSDTEYQSPFMIHNTPDSPKYLTFEPDEGGWNNVRMALETTIALAMSMGRILVLPPTMKYYRLWNDNDKNLTKSKQNLLNFDNFYHLYSIQQEHELTGLQIITFKEFLLREAMTGRIFNRSTNEVSFPPNNRTDWSDTIVNYLSTRRGDGKVLWEWIRQVTYPLHWVSETCVAAFPSDTAMNASDRMESYFQQVLEQDELKYRETAYKLNQRRWRVRQASYNGHPTPVNASAVDRLAELLNHRKQLCIYNSTMQRENIIHISGEQASGYRMLIHFYAFLFYEDYHTDLWIKRFIRDHFRYLDEIQCAAARIVQEIRKIVSLREKTPVNMSQYDSFHIRRGDFQYKSMHLTASEIYDGTTHLFVPDNRTVYIATDEGNHTFFDLFKTHYNVFFLDDFNHLLQGVNPNYYGMIDQLVASKGEVFIGTFYSTFSGYINRLRGYHTQMADNKYGRDHSGIISSHYYVPSTLIQFQNVFSSYISVQQSFWRQEFPVSWRDIDQDVNFET